MYNALIGGYVIRSRRANMKNGKGTKSYTQYLVSYDVYIVVICDSLSELNMWLIFKFSLPELCVAVADRLRFKMIMSNIEA